MAQIGHSALGMYLREAREARGISLGQAAQDTRIVVRYLAALEQGEFHHLPGDVYARGFLRNYGQYLNLPVEDLIEMYRSERGASAPIQVVPATNLPKVRAYFIPSAWAVVLVVTVIVVVGYLVLNALGLTAPQSTALVETAVPSVVATPQPLPTYTPAPELVNDPNNSGTPAPSNQTQTPQATPTPDSPVLVVVRIPEGQSWMQILADDAPVVDGILLSAGWTETFRADRVVSVKAGNAAAVEVSFNGGPFERMSTTPGAVITQLYTPPAD